MIPSGEAAESHDSWSRSTSNSSNGLIPSPNSAQPSYPRAEQRSNALATSD
jgi:hypothetical protein